MATYLVTGGCGFIGSHLAEALIGAGHRIRVLDDLSTGQRDHLPKSAELLVGDVRDTAAVGRALANVDGCFHLAAVVAIERGEKEWRHAHEVNLAGALNVFRQASRAREGNPVPVVYASSAAVYGDARELPVDEESPVRPISAYGADKAACELHAAVMAHGRRMSLTGLRFFNVYGPRQDPSSMYSGVVSVFRERLLQGAALDIFGDGRQTRDFIHVADVTKFLVAAMRSPVDGSAVYNVCTGNALSILELAEVLGQCLGKKPVLRFGPERSGDIRHSVGDPARAIAWFGCRADIDVRAGLAELMRQSGRPRRAGSGTKALAGSKR